MSLVGKNILITGAAKRIGRCFALTVAQAGANVFIHYHHSKEDAIELQSRIIATGREAYLYQADLNEPDQMMSMFQQIIQFRPLFALINNASIFEHLNWKETDLKAWEKHLMINLTAPFLLSQAFAQSVPPGQEGRIINILDWRALRPGADHLPYTISKAGLAALTRSMAQALAPQITVNGLALGAILPPSGGSTDDGILQFVPSNRWARLEEISQALLFLLDGPSYITGEIIHLDGGRHLV